VKGMGQVLLLVAAGLVALAATAPVLIRLSNSIVLPVIVVAVALIAVRLAWFHTRRW
jgi:hypothetical protein